MNRLRSSAAPQAIDQYRISAEIGRIEKQKHSKHSLRSFQSFAAKIAPVCQGQFLQDAWALWESDAKRGGFFVEFGAQDGMTFSNTYLLEKRFGWSGILAEPNPDCLPEIRANRSCFISNKCVYSRSGERLPFRITDVSGLSRLSAIDPADRMEVHRTSFREEMVETISLDDLLTEANAPPVIDFMSVDVEGAEYEILSHFDFRRWEVRAISVEHNLARQRDAILELLTRNGYRRIWPHATHIDDWYVQS